MDSRPLTIDRIDAWAIHECLQAALAGFSGRHESAEPWHGINVLSKLRPILLVFESTRPPTSQQIELSKGELACIDLNVPRTAYQGAIALLVRVFQAIEEINFGFPFTAEPKDDGKQAKLRVWQNGPDGPLAPSA
jgi:hypothetical protein